MHTTAQQPGRPGYTPRKASTERSRHPHSRLGCSSPYQARSCPPRLQLGWR
ncbi:hypothetical protein CJF30_00006796 [Rutstroemia sp. NJR-2017a BBW]|nr:hypothetical protein CJF30_00006796 [Rutstroemia sp. NJR-2017a BBW]